MSYQQQHSQAPGLLQDSRLTSQDTIYTQVSEVSQAPTTGGNVEKIQPQPYPLQGQALPTGWGSYPQGAYYPPPVQNPINIHPEEHKTHQTTAHTHTHTHMTTVPTQVQTTQVCQYCQGGQGTQYSTQNVSQNCQYCQREGVNYTTSSSTFSEMIPEVYRNVPSTFPQVQANPKCNVCYGTGYKHQSKTQDWRVCEACVREHGTDLKRFQGTTLVPSMELYRPFVNQGVPPPSLPRLNTDAHCVLCTGQGYVYDQAGSYWRPCDRCIKRNKLVCKKCVGTGQRLMDGQKCKCILKHIKPAPVTTNTPVYQQFNH